MRWALPFILFSIPAFSWEVDNVTCRFQNLTDSLSVLNREVNSRIQAAVQGRSLEDTPAIQGGPPRNEGAPMGCSREILEALRANIASGWMGNMETFAENSRDVNKCHSKENTIYSETSTWDLGVASLSGLGSSIRLSGQMVGVDKLSHFMTEGYDYFRAWEGMNPDKNQTPAQMSRETLMRLHQQGINEEEGGYGLRATGIYSHADTMANFQGFTFWKEILDGPNPFLKCENGRWVQKRQFDWAQYVNPAWDEGINCNRYTNTRMQAAVDRATARITSRYNYTRATRCPLDPAACGEVVQTYQPRSILDSILHPACYTAGGGNQTSETAIDHSKGSGTR